MPAQNDLDSRIERISNAIILYPRLEALILEMERCERMTKLAGEPHCMALEGFPGAGKTELLKYFIRKEPPYESPDGIVMPIFYMLTPSPTTVGGMAESMLEVFGDPGFHNGSSISHKNSRLVAYIKDANVRWVMLDDIQALTTTETAKAFYLVSDWLRVLIKKTGKPFLIVGQPKTVLRILNSNQQLSRLFAARKVLEPFKWTEKNKTSKEEFNELLLKAEEIIGMYLPDELPRTELLYRIYYATDGLIGNVMNLLRYAITIADERKMDYLTLEMFSIGFEARLRSHLNKSVNPFDFSKHARFKRE